MNLRAAGGVTLLLAALFVLPAGAAQFTTGDVIVATSQFTLGIPDPASIKIVSPSGTLKGEIPASPHHLSGLNVHNDTLYGSDHDVFTISTTGVFTSAGVSGPFLFDAADNLYSVRQPEATLEKRNPSGAVVGTWSLPSRPTEMDLAADQCTLYYLPSVTGSLVTIERFNLCTSQSLPPLNTTIPTPMALGNIRLLAGNEILLGTINGVFRIAPSGQLVRTYAVGLEIALDPDARFFWASFGDSVVKVDLATGDLVVRSDRFDYLADSLTVVGEPRAALSPGAAIPTLSEWGLLALCVALAAVATARFRG